MVIELGPQRLGELKNQAENFDGSLPPDALTVEQEIVAKLKQHQIALPDGQIVPAQGKINNRILSSLIAAFKGDRPSVGTKELIAPDTSAGIPIKEAKKRLRNSINRLRAITLMGSNWTIFTIRGNKGGYFLANTTSNTTENPSMQTITLTDGKTTISLPPRAAAMFQRIKDSEDNGMISEELQQPHIDAGGGRKTARFNVHDDLVKIRAALKNKPFKIENLTPDADCRRRKSARYAIIERSQEELALINGPKQGIETTIFAAKGDDDSVTKSPFEDPQEKHSSPWREWDWHGNIHLQPEILKKRLSEPKTKTTEGTLGVKANVHVLSSVLKGDLTQGTKDIKILLTDILHGNPSDFGEMKLDTLFYDTSPSRLNRFFKFNFTAMVDDCWNKEITPDTPEEKKQIIEIINELKEKSYDKTRVIQDVLGHFGIKIPAEYVASFTSSPAP